MRRRLHRHVGREHHARFTLQYGDVAHQCADQHEHKRKPCETWRREATIQKNCRGEIKDRDLKEDHPENQDVGTVCRQRQIE